MDESAPPSMCPLKAFTRKRLDVHTSAIATVAAWTRAAVCLVYVAREPRSEEAASGWAAELERVEVLEPHPLYES